MKYHQSRDAVIKLAEMLRYGAKVRFAGCSRSILNDGSRSARKIIGTSHAAYRDGMTWREFLSYGKRMHGKVDGLQRSPGYYRNPSHHHDDQPSRAGWSLLEIDGEYAIDEGNHRSVISRFLCEEERTNSQVVPVVTELTLDLSLIHI